MRKTHILHSRKHWIALAALFVAIVPSCTRTNNFYPEFDPATGLQKTKDRDAELFVHSAWYEGTMFVREFAIATGQRPYQFEGVLPALALEITIANRIPGVGAFTCGIRIPGGGLFEAGPSGQPSRPNRVNTDLIEVTFGTTRTVEVVFGVPEDLPSPAILDCGPGVWTEFAPPPKP